MMHGSSGWCLVGLDNKGICRGDEIDLHLNRNVIHRRRGWGQGQEGGHAQIQRILYHLAPGCTRGKGAYRGEARQVTGGACGGTTRHLSDLGTRWWGGAVEHLLEYLQGATVGRTQEVGSVIWGWEVNEGEVNP